MSLSKTQWHGLPAWTLENAAVRVVIVPDLGAKIASIYDKHANREWLLGPLRPIRPIPYAASFLDYDMSGWDEMFPTILACPHPAPGKYHGAALPDHGEVWALPWAVDKAGNSELTLSVEGRALPYRLSRTAGLGDGGVLKLYYRATNLSDEPLPYLWAAHPLFAVDTDTCIVLPPEVREVVNVFDSPAWGKAGTRYPWSEVVLQDGQTWQLAQVGDMTRQQHHKFFLPPEVSVSWAALAQTSGGAQLRLEWSKDVVPYLGIWVDEGAYLKAPTAALEPSTAYYDGMETAWNEQRYSTLPPQGNHEWEVLVRLESR